MTGGACSPNVSKKYSCCPPSGEGGGERDECDTTRQGNCRDDLRGQMDWLDSTRRGASKTAKCSQCSLLKFLLNRNVFDQVHISQHRSSTSARPRQKRSTCSTSDHPALTTKTMPQIRRMRKWRLNVFDAFAATQNRQTGEFPCVFSVFQHGFVSISRFVFFLHAL